MYLGSIVIPIRDKDYILQFPTSMYLNHLEILWIKK